MKLRFIFNSVLAFLVGALIFCLFSFLGKVTAGVQAGSYFTAVWFGGLSGLVVNLTLTRSRKILIQRLWQETRKRKALQKQMIEKTAELEKININLQNMALDDELTGLYNRRGFFVLAEQQLKIAAREQKEILVLFADIDGLKWINDSFGHGEGDVALKKVATILKETFRQSDIVARIGGDEFAILSLQTSWATADTLMERLQRNFDDFNIHSNLGYTLSISAGAATCSYKYPFTLEEMLDSADESMYQNKRNKQRRITRLTG